MQDTLVYRKTRRGAAELAATHGKLSTPARRVLIMLDGQRTLAELGELFGAEAVGPIVADLEAQGLARRVDPADPGETTQSVPIGVYSPGPPTMPAPQPGPQRATSRGGAWVLVVAAFAAAGAGGYWYTGRLHRTSDPGLAMASPAEPGSAPSAGSEDGGSRDPGSSVREVPLSGLPAVTVVSTNAAAGATTAATGTASAAPAGTARTARAAETAPREPAPEQAQAPLPHAATATPEPRPLAQEPKPAAPAEAASLPAVAGPAGAPRAVPVSLAANDSSRAERTLTDVAPAAVPTPAVAPAASALPLAAPSAKAAAPAPSPASQATKAAAPSSAAGGAAPGAAAPEQIAALAPSSPPRSGPVQLHERRHDPPEFPARALRAKIHEGHVLAHLWISPEGTVDQVDIVKATPPRVFDEEVKRALSLWTFDPPGHGVETTVELDFKP